MIQQQRSPTARRRRRPPRRKRWSRRSRRVLRRTWSAPTRTPSRRPPRRRSSPPSPPSTASQTRRCALNPSPTQYGLARECALDMSSSARLPSILCGCHPQVFALVLIFASRDGGHSERAEVAFAASLRSAVAAVCKPVMCTFEAAEADCAHLPGGGGKYGAVVPAAAADRHGGRAGRRQRRGRPAPPGAATATGVRWGGMNTSWRISLGKPRPWLKPSLCSLPDAPKQEAGGGLTVVMLAEPACRSTSDAVVCHDQAKLNQAKKYRAAAMPAVGSGEGDRAYREMVSDPSAPLPSVCREFKPTCHDAQHMLCFSICSASMVESVKRFAEAFR